MTPAIVIITIAAYFALLMVISWFASRGSNNSTFFNGNRQAPWGLVAFAMIGAAISGVTFISVPGMVAAKGYSYLQMVLGFIVGYFAIAFVLVPIFYRRNLISIYGYLEDRFGKSTYHTGAWFFFVSKMLGAAVRFYVVCVVLQSMVFGPLGIPFAITVVVSILLIWIYTVQGGVKTLIWTDTLKSFCLVASVGLCIYFIAGNLGLNFGEAFSAVTSHSSFKMFYFDDPLAGTYFWKQFLAGIFMAIALNGLDQDMMQRNLACRDSRQSQKNMIVSGITQFFVIALFLILGTMLLIYMDSKGMAHPAKPDDTFAAVVDSPGMPIIVGILFIVGLVSAAYSAAGSALTSLTTSFTVDIMGANRRMDDRRLAITRRLVHLGMSVAMGLVIIAFYYLSNQDAISAVYTLASYTYGPILGLFVFGLACKRPVRDCLVPAVCILAPVLSWVTQWALKEYCNYTTSFELLLMNAAFTILGLLLLLKPRKQV
ncbi:MAG: sodium:solute symporter [Muribaculaceae bacterium]|nr:sodium:solute symporter [Bacteroidales bacterium]MDY6186962.1 sodium:solute symporter [Muribaculaceae bacterium]